MKMKYTAQQGFTLIELAMVIFILALMMASFLNPLAMRVEQEARNTTQTQLDEIEEILYGYVLENQALPCPDCSDILGGCVAATANDGIADQTIPGTCDTEVGNLPWVDLGVKGTDEWGNIFTYRVDDVFADATDGTPYSVGPPVVQADCQNISATQNISFSLCSDGDITVLDSAGGANVATNIPALVVSHGKNFVDNNPSADELENINDDVTFVDKDYSSATGSEFDDMLIWISPHILRTMSVKAGILP